jgi:integrase
LLSTGARPLEIARLQVRDYLRADGSVLHESVMREDVAVNHKARPLFFCSANANAAIDRYLEERVHRGYCIGTPASYRGLNPDSTLFLTGAGLPFPIVKNSEGGQKRFLCRTILDSYRNIFRRIDLENVTAISLRRTVAARMAERGASEDQIGEVLGLSELKSVRVLLPKQRQPLPLVVRDLV